MVSIFCKSAAALYYAFLLGTALVLSPVLGHAAACVSRQ